MKLKFVKLSEKMKRLRTITRIVDAGLITPMVINGGVSIAFKLLTCLFEKHLVGLA